MQYIEARYDTVVFRMAAGSNKAAASLILSLNELNRGIALAGHATRELPSELKGHLEHMKRHLLRAISESVNANPDLSRADFRYMDLSGIRLEGANLQGANFSASNLSGAILCSVNLQDAVFHNSNLDGAMLTDARLEGSRWNSTSLHFAKLTGVSGMDKAAEIRSLSIHELQVHRLWQMLNGSLTGIESHESLVFNLRARGFSITEVRHPHKTELIREAEKNMEHWGPEQRLEAQRFLLRMLDQTSSPTFASSSKSEPTTEELAVMTGLALRMIQRNEGAKLLRSDAVARLARSARLGVGGTAKAAAVPA